MEDYGRDDREYWSMKYAEASCHEHGTDHMEWDEEEAEWFCHECELNWSAYKYG